MLSVKWREAQSPDFNRLPYTEALTQTTIPRVCGDKLAPVGCAVVLKDPGYLSISEF